VAALFYSLFGSAKLAGARPGAYILLATKAALRGERPPSPQETRERPDALPGP